MTAPTPEIDDAAERSDLQRRPAKSSRYNRRALLLGAAGVGVVATLAGAEPARAANGDDLSLGFANTANDTTSVTTATGNGLEGATSANGQSGLYGSDTSSAGGNGVYGQSTNGWGVSGLTTANGRSAVVGNDDSTSGGYGLSGNSTNGVGIKGTSSGDVGIYGTSTVANGVQGDTSANDSCGVQGNDNSEQGSSGVNGYSMNGFGLSGSSQTDHACYCETVGNGASGVFGRDTSSGGGNGVFGQSTNGWGVSGLTLANGKSAVVGNDESSKGGYGVKGTSLHGIGVVGETAVAKGIGLFALSTNDQGIALAVEGVATFTRSGLAKLAGSRTKPESSVKVKNVALSASSIVLVTPQDHVAGVAVAGVVKHLASKSFTVYLTKPARAPMSFGWFVIG